MDAFILDVDGVFTSPSESETVDNRILAIVQKILLNGSLVALNTGRPNIWIKSKILDHLLTNIQDKNILNNIFVIGEKGGTKIEFKNGEFRFDKNLPVEIPESLKTKIRNMIQEEFPDDLFFDESKETMITVQKIPSVSLNRFNDIHSDLNDRLKDILAEEDEEGDFILEPTVVDTDVQSKIVGKSYSTNLILDWMKENKSHVKKVIAIGDSSFDIQMAEEAYEHGFPVEYLFVGEPDKFIKSEKSFRVLFSDKLFNEAALEYLSKFV